MVVLPCQTCFFVFEKFDEDRGTTKTWWFNLKEAMQTMEKGQIGNAGISKLMRWKPCLELGWLTDLCGRTIRDLYG